MRPLIVTCLFMLGICISLDRLIIGSLPVASDAWISTYFLTGNSPAGYKLNSIQLSLDNATGDPQGFAVMLWDFRTRQSLANLTGNDPLASGVRTYTASDFALLPSTVYWFAVRSSSDKMSVRLIVDGLVEGHVHEFHLPGVRSTLGEPLLHDSAYYTLNKIPAKP